MRPPQIAVLAVAALVVLGLLAHAARGGPSKPGDGISDEQRRAGLTFEGDVAPADREWVRAAIASVRPEARRLIDEVDGLVAIKTGTVGDGGPMGYAQRVGPHRYTVWLNVGKLDGERYRDRNVVVVHELGHVIDGELIDDQLAAKLDAGIPRGDHCDVQDGVEYGSCAVPQERLADTFAKWALNGAVSAVGSGYALATPASLEDWGRPLGELALSLPPLT